MATELVDQVNVVNCSGGDLLGTGQEACPFDWDRVEVLELTLRSYVYTEVQTLDQVQQEQQLEKLIIIKGIKSFNLVPLEPNINTADGSGYKSVTGELPYEYTVLFGANGVNFWKALRSLNSKDRFNIAFYDAVGNKIFTQSKSGVFKGFSTKMLFTGQYKGAEGNTPAEYKMTIQLTDFKEMDRQSWIVADQLNFSPSDLDGVNDIILTPQPLATGATSLVVKTTLLDKSHFIDGLTLTDFRIKKGGVLVTPTAINHDHDAKTYTFTIPASTAGVYTVETWDATNTVGTIIVDPSGLLYKSNVASVVVA
jgi:hypothetical protein